MKYALPTDLSLADPSRNSAGRARGFTLFELLIALAIIALILASVVPFIVHQRELGNRVKCEQNLWILRTAMKLYTDNFGSYPRVRYDQQNNPNGWTAYTGADDANPFAPDSKVEPNDVTASMWLLVREGYVNDTAVFLCPSAGGTADALRDAAGKPVPARQRGNFRSSKSLGYSMFSPFSSAPYFVWADTLKPECVLLADKSPGISGGSDVREPAANAQPEAFSQANSVNHRRAGQNVLYADGSVQFVTTPYVGVGYQAGYKDSGGQWVAGKPGDNIYTALQSTPVPEGATPPAEGNGVYGKNIGPSWLYDSYLVPSDDE